MNKNNWITMASHFPLTIRKEVVESFGLINIIYINNKPFIVNK